MRDRAAQFALILVALVQSNVSEGAEPQHEVALIPIADDDSQACTLWLRDLIEEMDVKVHVRANGAPVPDIQGWRGVSSWVRKHRAQFGRSELAILGVRYGKVLRIDVYRVADGTLQGLKTVKVARDCAVSERQRRTLSKWLEIRLSDEPERGAQRSARGIQDPLFVDVDEESGPPSFFASTATLAEQEHRALWLGAEMRLVSRQLDFSGHASGAIRGYSMGLVAVPRIFVGLKALSRLAAEVGISRSLLLDSTQRDGASTFPSALFEASAELTYRVPVEGVTEAGAVQIGPVVGARHVSFRLFRASDAERNAGTPEVRYTSVLLGGAVEVPLSTRAWIDVFLAYQPILGFGQGLGELGARSGSGLELRATVRIAIVDELSLRFAASYQAYFMDLERTDLALGASDEMPQLGLGLAYDLY